mmetsp:Transcript_17441/g.54038  ORF Transcript_17441/g.54038 Transcript_17441/m.54038 type:complete len:228 (+) Transcript_17441:136-819(+)
MPRRNCASGGPTPISSPMRALSSAATTGWIVLPLSLAQASSLRQNSRVRYASLTTATKHLALSTPSRIAASDLEPISTSSQHVWPASLSFWNSARATVCAAGSRCVYDTKKSQCPGAFSGAAPPSFESPTPPLPPLRICPPVVEPALAAAGNSRSGSSALACAATPVSAERRSAAHLSACCSADNTPASSRERAPSRPLARAATPAARSPALVISVAMEATELWHSA